MQSNEESYRSARQRFIDWAVQWGSENPAKAQDPIDATQLMRLLGAIGFNIHKISMSPPTDTTAMDVAEDHQRGTCRLVITCAKSGLKAILQTDRVECQCPTGSHTNAEMSGQGSTDHSMVIAPFNESVALMVREVLTHLAHFDLQPEAGACTSNEAVPGATYDASQQQSSVRFYTYRQFNRNRFGSVDELLKEQSTENAIPGNKAVSNSAQSSCPGSPLLASCSLQGQPLVRQKTWSISSINELDSQQPLPLEPTRTSSPIPDRVIQPNDVEVITRLRDASSKIIEAISMLDISLNSQVPEGNLYVAPEAIGAAGLVQDDANFQANKLSTSGISALALHDPVVGRYRASSDVSRSSSIQVTQPYAGSNLVINSRNSSIQTPPRLNTSKRHRSPSGGASLGQKTAAESRTSKRSQSVSTPKSVTMRKSQENDIRGSYINVSDPIAGNSRSYQIVQTYCVPGVQSRRSSYLAGFRQNVECSSQAGYMKSSAAKSTTNLGSPSTPTTSRNSLAKTSSINSPKSSSMNSPKTISMNSSKSLKRGDSAFRLPGPSSINTPTAAPKTRKEGSKSVLRPSMLRTPSIINRFKK